MEDYRICTLWRAKYERTLTFQRPIDFFLSIFERYFIIIIYLLFILFLFYRLIDAGFIGNLFDDSFVF